MNQGAVDLRDLMVLKRDVDNKVENLLERLVHDGVPFETLGAVMSMTGAGVRIKAKRRGWYTPGEPR